LMTFSNEPILLQMYTTSLRDLVMTFSSFNLQLSSLFLLRWISSVYLSSFKWVKKEWVWNIFLVFQRLMLYSVAWHIL
jgi:hypothetical protein